LEPEVARQINDILPGVIYAPDGTGRRANIDRPAGGKTGSAQQNTDAWFCGFTPQLATAVWVGFSETRPGGDGTARLVSMVPGNTPITVFGGTYPAQIWAAFMKSALDGLPALPLNPPAPPPTTTTTSPEPPEILEPPAPPETERRGEVPAVLDLVGDEAVAAVRKAGFTAKVATIEAGSEAAPGRAVAQSPAGGSQAPDGSTVWIEVTAGAPASKTPIPDLRGYGRNQAIEEVQRLYFKVTTRATAPPTGARSPLGTAYAGGQVWRTTPGPGELSPDGTVVLDYVPEGPPPTTTASTTTAPP
jgi:penicillin-binding protein 1A